MQQRPLGHSGGTDRLCKYQTLRTESPQDWRLSVDRTGFTAARQTVRDEFLSAWSQNGEIHGYLGSEFQSHFVLQSVWRMYGRRRPDQLAS